MWYAVTAGGWADLSDRRGHAPVGRGEEATDISA
jgi:hypothetical protein